MKVLVIGSGGREYAIVKKIVKNKKVSEVYCIPGNGGIERFAKCIPLSPTDIVSVVQFAKDKKIDFCIVTPDDPLVLGMVNELEVEGIRCFGPTKEAAIIEGSKSFAKELMKKNNIPTASYEVFDDVLLAREYINKSQMPLVIKADGLALGKGVIIAETKEEANNAVDLMMLEKKFGESGRKVVIEEFLTGPEVSVLAFTDGKSIVPMVSSMDHKRIGEGDTGLNTGGMGVIAPNPYYTEKIANYCMKNIFIPTIEALNREGRKFKGCIYFGLMITEDGPKVIEYNCRFGDPETQAVLPLLKTDLLDIMFAVSEERLGDINVEFSEESSCCVIMASNGYPVSYKKGYEINYPKEIEDNLYFAGVVLEDDVLKTSGGRVLGVTVKDAELDEAIKNAYMKVGKVSFKDAYYRRDIGKKALEKAY
ncbi:MAG: phosphoribosylamine--glycine ligase [Clostridiales bacterium]|nr:MAG: phosphoribosylamine--glycine ligase [Clostridiales bacterium]